MLTIVRLALRISTTAFDSEISQLINDCLHELRDIGIIANANETTDPQIVSCVIFYCKANFGSNPESERWSQIYHDKVSRLRNSSMYGLR